MEPITNPTTSFPSWRILAIGLLLISAAILLPASPAFLEPFDHGGYALSFDGDSDRVAFQETSQVFGAGWADTKSVSIWVKPTASTPCTIDPANCDVIMSEKPHWWGITIGQIGVQDKIWVWNYDGDTDFVGVDYTLNEWVHITLVHDGGVLRAFRNGIEVGSTPSSTTMRPDGGEDSILYLGGIPPGGPAEDWTFAGELDEVRFWNVARSTTAVQQDMFDSLNGDEPGLAAYYKMSDGSGTTLTDDTGNGWNGTLLADGAPQWITSTIPHDGGPAPTPTSTATPPGPMATNTPTPTPTGTLPTNTPTPTPTGTVPTSTPTPTATGTLPTPTAEPTDALIYLPLVNRH